MLIFAVVLYVNLNICGRSSLSKALGTFSDFCATFTQGEHAITATRAAHTLWIVTDTSSLWVMLLQRACPHCDTKTHVVPRELSVVVVMQEEEG